MTQPPRRPEWRKSSYSADQNDCVEVLIDTDQVGLRDTKNREGGAIYFSPESWLVLLAKVKEEQ